MSVWHAGERCPHRVAAAVVSAMIRSRGSTPRFRVPSPLIPALWLVCLVVVVVVVMVVAVVVVVVVCVCVCVCACVRVCVRVRACVVSLRNTGGGA